MCDFDKELKKLWVAIEDKAKRADERFDLFEDRVNGIDVGVTRVESRLAELERQRREVTDKRRKLMKKLKETMDQGKRAWIMYDTLYVNGTPVRE